MKKGIIKPRPVAGFFVCGMIDCQQPKFIF